jgi:hypothetical protein
MTSRTSTLFLALVASVTGVIIRGPNVTYDTYIMGGTGQPSNTNYNAHYNPLGWDGPLTMNWGTQAISSTSKDTQALLIKFDISSVVGATLVPNKPVWLNYYVTNAGDNATLRELLVPWNDVCTPTAKTRTPLTTAWHLS